VLTAFDDGRLFAERVGAGEPVVLALHGWRRSHSDLLPALSGEGTGGAALAAIAPDLPGFGATPAPGGPWGSACYARALGPVLDTMAGEVVVLGHSFGGRVALELAVQRPEQVVALVLTGVPLPLQRAGSDPARAYRLVRALARRGLVSEARLERARQRHGSADYRAATGVMREVLVKVLAEPYESLLSAIRCPVELLWGGDDVVVPPEVAERAATVCQTATVRVVDGVGHLLPLEAPAELRAALDRAVASITARRSTPPRSMPPRSTPPHQERDAPSEEERDVGPGIARATPPDPSR
jgi:pimeloyl-ACP methyl ester carboxylesterase